MFLFFPIYFFHISFVLLSVLLVVPPSHIFLLFTIFVRGFLSSIIVLLIFELIKQVLIYIYDAIIYVELVRLLPIGGLELAHFYF